MNKKSVFLTYLRIAEGLESVGYDDLAKKIDKVAFSLSLS